MKQAFKHDIIQDVAAAANLDPKYLSIAVLRAGSVIIDMLIAPEAGEPNGILQGLVAQSKIPGSALMQGKLTSKTTTLASGAQPMTPSTATMPVSTSAGATMPATAFASATLPGTGPATRPSSVDTSQLHVLQTQLTSAETRVVGMEEEIERQHMLVESLKDRIQEDTFSHEKFQKESVAHVEELDKEIEDLKDRLDIERFQRLKLAKDSAVHVTELENEIQGIQTEFEAAKTKCAELQVLLDNHPIVSAGLATEADAPAAANQAGETPGGAQPDVVHVPIARGAGEEVAIQELERLKMQVNSLTFQLQEVQGKPDSLGETAPSKREPTRVAKTLEPPPSTAGHESSGRRPNTTSRQSSPERLARRPFAERDGPGLPAAMPRRNVLEPPPSTSSVFPHEVSSRRSSASSRQQSPERVNTTYSPPRSPSRTPVDSKASVSVLHTERDEATAQLAKAQQEVAELRAIMGQMLENSKAKIAAQLEIQTNKVASEATVAVLGEQLASLQEKLDLAAAVREDAGILDVQVRVKVAGDGVPGETPAVAAAALDAAAVAVLHATIKSLEGEVAAAKVAAATLQHEAAATETPQHAPQYEAATTAVAALHATIKLLEGEVAEAKTAATVAAVASTDTSAALVSVGAANVKKLESELTKIRAIGAELEAKTRESDKRVQQLIADNETATKKCEELQATAAKLQDQIDLTLKMAAETSSGKAQDSQKLNDRLAEALSTANAEQAKAVKLQDQMEKSTEMLEKLRAESTALKKEKLELLTAVDEAGKAQRTTSVTVDAQVDGLKSSLRTSTNECELLQQQVHALEVVVGEMRGKEYALQEQLSTALSELAAAKDTNATIHLDSQKSGIDLKRLQEAETKLLARLEEMTSDKAKCDMELERVKKELQEFNGTRYGELQSLKAQLEIMKQENEALVLGKSLDAASKSVSSLEAPEGRVFYSPNVSPQRRRNDAYFGAMEEDLRVSSGALNNVQQMLHNSSLNDLDSEINRLNHERASSPHKPQAQQQSYMQQQQPVRPVSVTYSHAPTATSPSRRTRSSRDLQERLDLLAAALSYNGLTVISGFSAFDQDRDGRVSMEDLRKSMNDLELAVQHAELQALFSFMDTDHDGFVSEIEWGAALRDADPFSVLASQGVRTLEIKVPPDADAHLQAVDAFETMKQELTKSLEAQHRMKASLDQASRSRAELEEDLRRIRTTRSDLETELRSVREEMSRMSTTPLRHIPVSAPTPALVPAPGVTAEVSELRERISTRDGEIATLRQQLATAQSVVSSPTPAVVETSVVVDALRLDIDGKTRQISELTSQLAQAHAASIPPATITAPPGESEEMQRQRTEIAELRRQLAAAQDVACPPAPVTAPPPDTITVPSEEAEQQRKELEALRTEASHLKKQLLDLGANEKSFASALQVKETLLCEKETRITELVAKCSALEVQAAEAKSTSASTEKLSSELETVRRSVQEVTVAKDAGETRERSMTAQLAERDSEIEQLRCRISDLTRTELEHASELESQRAKYAETQELFQKACAERDAIRMQVASAKSAEVFAKDQMHSKATDLVRVETELASLKERFAGAEEQSNRLIELQARVIAREADASKLKEEGKASALEIVRLKGEISAQKEVHRQQVNEIQELAGESRLCVIERQHKVEAQDKLKDALLKVAALDEQIEQLHVLRSTDTARANESAMATVQDRLLEKDTETQRLKLQVEQLTSDLEASRRDRDAMVVQQTQALQDELLRVTTTSSEEQSASKSRLAASQEQSATLHQQVATLQQQVRRLQEELDRLQASTAASVDNSVVEEYKRSLALKESEIESLRSTRAHESGSSMHEMELLRVRMVSLAEEKTAVDQRAGSLDSELTLSREENDYLKRRLSDLSEDTSHAEEMRVLREGTEAVQRDLELQSTRSAATNDELRQTRQLVAQLQQELEVLRKTSSEVDVMRERVLRSESEVKLAKSETALVNTKLDQLDSVRGELERKDRDLAEERERYERLRGEMQETRGGSNVAASAAEGKYSVLEQRLSDAEHAKHSAEFNLQVAVKERSATNTKFSEITDELASARVSISTLESALKVAKEGQGKGAAVMDERIQEISAGKERYERKYRETQQQLKEEKDECARLERRVKEVQEALDLSVGPSDSHAQDALRCVCVCVRV